MEKKFWFVTMMFFMAVVVCFLMIASQRLPGAVSPAVASPHQASQSAQVQDASLFDIATGDVISNSDSR